MEVLLSIVSAVLLLGLFFVLIYIALRNRRLGVAQICFALALYVTQVVLYNLGIYNGVFQHESVFVSLYDCAKIFVFDFGFPEFVNPLYAENSIYVVWMSIIAITGGLFTVLSVMMALMNVLSAKIRCAFFMGREIALFFGDDDNSLTLAKNIKSKNKRMLVVVYGEKKHDDYEYDGLAHLPAKSAGAVAKWRKLRGKAVSFFFVTNDSEKNIASAYQAANEIPQTVYATTEFHFYVATDDGSVKSMFDRISKDKNLLVNIFSAPALTAQKAMETGLYDGVEFLPEAATSARPFHFLISGGNEIGKAFLQELSVRAQIAPHLPHCILNDADISVLEGSILGSCPQIHSCMGIEFTAHVPGSTAFYEVVQKNLRNLNYIVLCHEDERLNYEVGTQIASLYRRLSLSPPPIMVYTQNENRYAYFAESPESACIRLFGRIKDIFCEEVVVAGVLDRAAQTLQTYYEDTKQAEEAAKGNEYKKLAWRNLEIFTQNSNRRAVSAFGLVTKLLGLNNREEKDKYLKDAETFREFIGERLNTLTETEHLRWNAVHYMDGWTTKPLAEVLKTGTRKDVAEKRHVCLVSFEELKELEEQLATPYIAYDADNILRMPKLYKKFPEIF